MKKVLLIALALVNTHTTQSITLVYSMKIRRAAQLPTEIKSEDHISWLVTTLPIMYERDRHIVDSALSVDVCENSRVGGVIFNIRLLAPHYWWAEVTTGIENQTSKTTGTQNFRASRTGFDDVVVSFGKNFLFGPDDKGQVAFYALGGFPTRLEVTPQERTEALLGSRFFGMGPGAEISYSFIKEHRRSLTGIAQVRFLHFFNRTFFPILPCNARIQPGNVSDLFLITQYREKQNVFEVGYNPTFFTNQAVLLATGKVPGESFTRNSFYADVTHLFRKSWGLKRPGAVSAGFSIGRSTFLDTRTHACWISVSLLF